MISWYTQFSLYCHNRQLNIDLLIVVTKYTEFINLVGFLSKVSNRVNLLSICLLIAIRVIKILLYKCRYQSYKAIHRLLLLLKVIRI